MPLPAQKQCYTFADFLTWDEHPRSEIISGEVFLMTTPSSRHQEICFEIGRQLGNYLEAKQCRVYPAPFGVCLFEQNGSRPEDIDTIVEPDLSVVCDREKIDRYGCKGAPDLVVEVLSPSTQRQDQLVKLNLYQRAGIREYWIAAPENETVRVMLRADDATLRTCEVYGRDDVAKVHVLDGCFLELGKVFSQEPSL